jgi:hypothetical protein
MTTPTSIPLSISATDVTAWVTRYLDAWRSNDPDDIAGLFTADGEYHESPYDTHWIGRDAIVEGWRSRWNWQQGGWMFDWHLVSLDAATATITGIGRYTELGEFDNRWTVTFRSPGSCADFRMVNTERGTE